MDEDVKQRIEALRGIPLYHARIGKDGVTIRCAAVFTELADGSKRYQCGEALGQRFIEHDVPVYWFEDEEHVEQFITEDVPIFKLPSKFGYSKRGDIYRVTQKPHYRTEGYDHPVILTSGKYAGKQIRQQNKGKTHDRKSSYWGEHGEFVLPISVLCPRCGRVNLISESLIEGSLE